MKDKNEFRHLKQNDLREHYPWYRGLYESVKEDIESLLALIDKSEEDKSNNGNIR